MSYLTANIFCESLALLFGFIFVPCSITRLIVVYTQELSPLNWWFVRIDFVCWNFMNIHKKSSTLHPLTQKRKVSRIKHTEIKYPSQKHRPASPAPNINVGMISQTIECEWVWNKTPIPVKYSCRCLQRSPNIAIGGRGRILKTMKMGVYF